MAEIATWYCRRCFEPFGPGTLVCPEHQLKLVEVRDPGTGIVGDMVDGKYKVESVLGIGGMGTVFRARQMPIEREVALKILNHGLIRDKTGVKRFIQEAQAASALKSRYSAMIYDFGLSYEGYLYFTMELVGGRLLSEVLLDEKKLPVERTLHVAIDVCRSLEEAHLRGIIHRDIKPGNIMLSELDGHEIAKVLDFGTAELMTTWKKTSKLTDLGKVHGTAEYMSPEQAQAKPVTVSTDFYSLGITIYEMLAGVPPFTGPAAIPVLLSHVNDAPRPLSEAAPDIGVTPELNDLVMRLLAKSPEARFDSAQELRYRLEDILSEIAGPLSGGALRLHLARPDMEPRRRNIVIFDTVVQRHGSRKLEGRPEHAAPSRSIQQTMTLDPKQLWREAEARTATSEPIVDPGPVDAGRSTPQLDDASPRLGTPSETATQAPGEKVVDVRQRTIIDAADAFESKTPTVPDMPAVRRGRTWVMTASLAATVVGAAFGSAAILLYSGVFGISVPWNGGSTTAPPAAVAPSSDAPLPHEPKASTPDAGAPTAAAGTGQAACGAESGKTPLEVPTEATAAAPTDGSAAEPADVRLSPPLPDAGAATANEMSRLSPADEGAAQTSDIRVDAGAAGIDAPRPAFDTVPADAGKEPAGPGTDQSAFPTEPAKAGTDQAVGSQALPGKGEEKKSPEDGNTSRPPRDGGKAPAEKKGVGKEKIKFSEEDLQ